MPVAYHACVGVIRLTDSGMRVARQLPSAGPLSRVIFKILLVYRTVSEHVLRQKPVGRSHYTKKWGVV